MHKIRIQKGSAGGCQRESYMHPSVAPQRTQAEHKNAGKCSGKANPNEGGGERFNAYRGFHPLKQGYITWSLRYKKSGQEGERDALARQKTHSGRRLEGREEGCNAPRGFHP